MPILGPETLLKGTRDEDIVTSDIHQTISTEHGDERQYEGKNIVITYSNANYIVF
jgi:hypothetical protein